MLIIDYFNYELREWGGLTNKHMTDQINHIQEQKHRTAYNTLEELTTNLNHCFNVDEIEKLTHFKNIQKSIADEIKNEIVRWWVNQMVLDI